MEGEETTMLHFEIMKAEPCEFRGADCCGLAGDRGQKAEM